MEETQHPKLLEDIPPVDIVITMGCNVECPYLPCMHREDWGLDDPTGKNDSDFIEIIKKIETKIKDLKSTLTRPLAGL
jgi:arsenate reductase